jgi:formylglycine-generating enzyme required for sulfatase activity
VLQPTSRATYRAREGASIEYTGRTTNRSVHWENLPVVGVSYEDGLAFAAWLDRTGEVPGARPCTSLEWERAARGADGRAYPQGEQLSPSDANFDETYGRIALAFGLDEVGSHPASDSPYGVADLLGNAWEATTGLDGKPWLKGGSFYQDRASALSTNNWPSEPTQRGIRYGLRMCTSR